jgi:hypothetical protein
LRNSSKLAFLYKKYAFIYYLTINITKTDVDTSEQNEMLSGSLRIELEPALLLPTGLRLGSESILLLPTTPRSIRRARK